MPVHRTEDHLPSRIYAELKQKAPEQWLLLPAGGVLVPALGSVSDSWVVLFAHVLKDLEKTRHAEAPDTRRASQGWGPHHLADDVGLAQATAVLHHLRYRGSFFLNGSPAA